jgi:hypothetical protein
MRVQAQPEGRCDLSVRAPGQSWVSFWSSSGTGTSFARNHSARAAAPGASANHEPLRGAVSLSPSAYGRRTAAPSGRPE